MKEKMDILNRQPFVNRLIDIVRLLADNHKGCTFAIDGAWGCGKSFILEMFEKQISLFQDPAAAGDRFLLFHYNCWQYDYYDEPAIAICASIREQADKMSRLFPQPTPQWEAAIAIVKNIGKGLVCNFVETKLGIDTDPIFDLLGEYNQEKKSAIQKNHTNSSYDSYFSFRQVLNETRNDLAELSKEKPIIIVVDELDRCLPEYAITVLERLHHLFDCQKNIIVVLAIDKSRLGKAIQKVYGIDPDSVPDFLRKYISFSLDVGYGSISEAFWDRHSEYLSMFVKPDHEEMDELNRFASTIFSDLDIRSQEKILERCTTIHKLVCTDMSDLALLYFELIHQLVMFKTKSASYLRYLAELNKSKIPSFEETLGKTPYEYLCVLEKMSISQHGRYVLNNNTYNVLNNTISGRAFWLLTRIYFPLSGNVCHHYAMTELDCENGLVDAARLFHELACLMN